MTHRVVETHRYRIFSDTDSERVDLAATLMEAAAGAYRDLLGREHCPEDVPEQYGEYRPFTIYLYGEWRQFHVVAASLGFPPAVRGFYSPEPPAAMHVLLSNTSDREFRSLLLHEGLHQWADRYVRLPFPQAGTGKPVYTGESWLALPLWLNEGLATYMESARLEQGRLITGDPNRERLQQLQRMIRSGYRFSPADILGRPYGASFSSGDYAVAWGIVYDLLREADRDCPGGSLLDRYLAALRENLSREALRQPGPAGAGGDGGFHAWNAVLAEQSLKTFRQVVPAEGEPMTEWERHWRRRLSTPGHD